MNPVRLRREMAMRGLSGADLAALAHVSRPTVTAALQGRRINTRTAIKIATALASTAPKVPAELLAEEAAA